MRHQRKGKKLGRDSAHRKALYSNLAGALIEHGRIKTTEAKAKAVKPIAEKMITLGRRGDLAARRQALAYLRSQEVVHQLFAEVAPRFADRPGGYSRIVKLGPALRRRRRDGLPRARRLRAAAGCRACRGSGRLGCDPSPRARERQVTRTPGWGRPSGFGSAQISASGNSAPRRSASSFARSDEAARPRSPRRQSRWTGSPSSRSRRLSAAASSRLGQLDVHLPLVTVAGFLARELGLRVCLRVGSGRSASFHSSSTGLPARDRDGAAQAVGLEQLSGHALGLERALGGAGVEEDVRAVAGDDHAGGRAAHGPRRRGRARAGARRGE